MAWYQIFYDICNNLRTRNKDKTNLMEDYTFLDTTKDFFEGMRSIGDLTGERYFNDFKNYPTNPRERIWGHWNNVGTHLHNAMESFSEQKGLPHPSLFRGKIKYY